MRKYLIMAVLAFTTLALSSCSTPSSENKVGDIPDKPVSSAPLVNAADYQNSYGSYVFRIGGGTVWCTINPTPLFVLCEHNEVDVNYKMPETPAGCQGAWGYQARLFAYQPSVGKMSDWYCSSGLFSDPEGAFDLPNGSKISVGAITCYAADTIARCDNETGQYFALGADVYGFGN